MSGLLLVEDDDRYGGQIARAFAAKALTVIWLRSCAEVHTFLRAPMRPKIRHAIIDDRLPDGFGLDLLPLLDSLDPRPAALVVSGYSSADRDLAALRVGQAIFSKSWKFLNDALAVIEAKMGSDVTAPELHSGVHARPKSPDTPRRFGLFVLGSDGLLTPTGFVVLHGETAELLRFLIGRTGRFTSSMEVAHDLFGRSDLAGPGQVRQRVYKARRDLGDYGWLIGSDPKRGYRIAPGAFGLAAENFG